MVVLNFDKTRNYAEVDIHKNPIPEWAYGAVYDYIHLDIVTYLDKNNNRTIHINDMSLVITDDPNVLLKNRALRLYNIDQDFNDGKTNKSFIKFLNSIKINYVAPMKYVERDDIVTINDIYGIKLTLVKRKESNNGK